MSRKIRIGFSSPKGKYLPLFAWFIKYGESLERYLYTGKWDLQKYSHCYVQWHAQRHDETLVYEASGTSVHFLGEIAAKKKLKPVEIYELETNDEAMHRMVKKCMRYSGVKYGVLQILGIVWVKAVNLYYFKKDIEKTIKNPLSDGTKTQVCLETVGEALEPHIKEKPEDLENWGVREMREFVKNIPGVVKIL